MPVPSGLFIPVFKVRISLSTTKDLIFFLQYLWGRWSLKTYIYLVVLLSCHSYLLFYPFSHSLRFVCYHADGGGLWASSRWSHGTHISQWDFLCWSHQSNCPRRLCCRWSCSLLWSCNSHDLHNRYRLWTNGPVEPHHSCHHCSINSECHRSIFISFHLWLHHSNQKTSLPSQHQQYFFSCSWHSRWGHHDWRRNICLA